MTAQSRRWVSMGKSIANIYRYAEISKAANRRFLNSMHDIIPVKSIEKKINSIREKNTLKGKTYIGYNVWSSEVFRLFEEVSDGKYLICGFTNQDTRKTLCKGDPETAKERGRMSKALSKFRAHGLIRKILHYKKHLVSDKGYRVIGALIESKCKTYPEPATS